MVTETKVIADTGSEEVRLTRLALNDAADAIEGVQVAVIASADASDLATAITLVNEIKASLNVTAAIDVTALRKIIATVVVPPARSFPTTSP